MKQVKKTPAKARAPKFLSIEDAAARLSETVKEAVDARDVLELACAGELAVAVHFDKPLWVQGGQVDAVVQPPAEEPTSEREADFGSEPDADSPVTDGRVQLATGDVFIPHATFDLVKGLFDLPMIGAEIGWVETARWMMSGGSAPTWHHRAAFVRDGEGRVFQLFEAADGAADALVAVSRLPAGATLVVRPSELESLGPAQARKESTRERDTLDRIIAGLIHLTLGKTPSGKANSVYRTEAAVIDALIAAYPGVEGFAKSTMEQKLSRAKKTLMASIHPK